MNEHRIHQIFVISVILKGLDAILEFSGGIILYFISTDEIVRWVNLLTQEELLEDPRDYIATRLMRAAQHLSVGTQSFYSFYLLIHGVVKIVLVISLLKEILWAYPASLVVLTAFIAYQLYRFTYTHSLGLIALTAFDVLVMALVWHEWHILRNHVRSTKRRRY